jgi:TRAP-type uncharacterized transport system substrate-binding protein
MNNMEPRADASDAEEQEDARISLPMEALKSILPYLVAIAFIVGGAYWLIDPAPPKTIVIAVSRHDSDYHAFAQLYAALLKQDGITLDIRESDGPLQALDQLRAEDGGVDMAFLEGGTATAESSLGIVSLGSLYYEPIWIFSPRGQRIAHLSSLKGKRIAIGETNTGISILSRTLLSAAGVNEQNSKFLAIGDEDAADALQHGAADAIFISGLPTSPLVQTLAANPRLAMADLDEAEAFSRQFTFLHHLVLPEGALNLEANVPSHPVNLLVPTVTLVARDSMHPALVYLVLKVISRVHSSAGMLQGEHEFPSDKDTDFELSAQAKKFYESGLPFFDRYLPFWAATFLSRALIVLVPLIALAIPITRMAPSAYAWLIKSRIYKLYGELRYLETQLHSHQHPLDPELCRKELDAIEHRVNHMRLPVAFSSHLYELRSHIELVRSKLP